MKKFDTGLYLVTDSSYHDEEKFFETVEQALKGGVTILQLREKNISTAKYIELAKKMKKLSEKYNVKLLIDDRVDVAYASDADGVHLGAEDFPIDMARKLLGDEKIIGATAKTVESAIKAEKMGADYLGVGAIYPTATKVKTVITSVDTLKDICKNVKIPVNAIGGLDKDNLDVLKGSGVSGICVVRAIMLADDPKKAAEELLKKSNEICK